MPRYLTRRTYGSATRLGYGLPARTAVRTRRSLWSQMPVHRNCDALVSGSAPWAAPTTEGAGGMRRRRVRGHAGRPQMTDENGKPVTFATPGAPTLEERR